VPPSVAVEAVACFAGQAVPRVMGLIEARSQRRRRLHSADRCAAQTQYVRAAASMHCRASASHPRAAADAALQSCWLPCAAHWPGTTTNADGTHNRCMQCESHIVGYYKIIY
jgi:hypothetical protein